MIKRTILTVVFIGVVVAVANCAYGFGPSNVLVVYNANPSPLIPADFIAASAGSALYYAQCRSIPSGNLLGLATGVPAAESILTSQYVAYVATPISNYLSQHPGITTICLVYGVPSGITDSTGGAICSVDSALTLLGNPNVLSVLQLGLPMTNPYYGKDMSWESFRDSSLNVITGANAPSGYKLKYLVCRLDGYSVPTTAVTIDSVGYNIPSDIKNMIDRSVASDSAGRAAMDSAGTCVLDDCPFVIVPRDFSSDFIDSLTGTGIPASNIQHPLGTDWATDVFATGNTSVMLYSSSESYDYAAYRDTIWFRPGNGYLPGAVAITRDVSGDGGTLRQPSFMYPTPDTAATPQPNTLKVYMWPQNGWNRLSPYGPIEFNCGLYSGYGLTLYARIGQQTQQLAATTFDSAGESVTHGDYTLTVPVARIDLSSVSSWPGNNCYFTVTCPSNDLWHPGETIGQLPLSTDIYDARSTGITYTAGFCQSLAVELIREGASATTANVNEPGPYAIIPQTILYEYSKGRSWVESAYLSFASLGWMQTAIGDPLMSPYAVHPTMDFLDPAPDDQSRVAGHVTLEVDPEPDWDGPVIGDIAQVEFDQVNSSGITTTIATDTSLPYDAVWDTTSLSNGTYSVRATALQEGLAVGSVTETRTFTVDSTIPAISLVSPDSTGSWIVTSQTTITATTQGDPSSVEFWLFEKGSLALVTTCSASPYQCQIGTSFSDDTYQLQAVARYANGSSYYSPPQTLYLANNAPANLSIGGLISQTADDSTGTLVNVVVTAGTDCTTLGGNASTKPKTFYVEDVNRSGGIRIEADSTANVVEGDVVNITGIVHKLTNGVTPRERYIEVDSGGVDSVGSQTVPRPLGMVNKFVGGSAPSGQPGVFNGIGLGNIGLLIKVWGNVTYVGDDCFYIDDGSGLQDGNKRQCPVTVPLDGSAFLDSAATPVGMRVYCGSLPKPGFGDYVAATGISSSLKIITNGTTNFVRCVRMRNTSNTPAGTNPDLSILNGYTSSYTQAAKEPTWSPADGGSTEKFKGVYVAVDSAGDLQELAVGSKVRLDACVVEQQTGTGVSDGVLQFRHCDWTFGPQMPNSGGALLAHKMWWPEFAATYTSLSQHDCVTILGTTYVYVDSSGDQRIIPDKIYKRYPNTAPSGSEMMAMSVRPADADSTGGTASSEIVPGESEPGGGPIGPALNPDDSYILQTDSFKEADGQVGAIGWALSQIDGTTVDLTLEHVVDIQDGGQTLALKEWFEPGTPAPRLLLKLGTSVQGSISTSATIDIIGATLTTLPDGRRALINPEAVYVYLDEDGNIASPMPPFKATDTPPAWTSKRQIVP